MALFDMNDVMLCLALALRIHGTDAAVRATAYSLRSKVRREIQPLVARIIRHPQPTQFVELYLGVRG
jgi:hypothetical protein